MSKDWNEGYFTDFGYTQGYYREINPVYLSYVSTILGYSHYEPNAGKSYCELGIGQGISFVAHGLANEGLFFGTDFNPAHIQNAKGLLPELTTQINLYEDSFLEFLERDDLPMFDTIVLHGIWTWVSANNHDYILKFIKKRLKTGGTLYISYNCFPGWGYAYPLRQIFYSYDKYLNKAIEPNERIGGAIDFATRFLELESGYAQTSPLLKSRLEGLRSLEKAYLAHEYFNDEWNCMYFTDVARRMEGIKLSYIGTADLIDQLEAVNLKPGAVDFLNQVHHPLAREQMRDYFVNRQFRKDVYLRGANKLLKDPHWKALKAIPYVLNYSPKNFNYQIQGAYCSGTLHKDVYEPVLSALDSGNASVKFLDEIADICEGLDPVAIHRALVNLVHLGVVSPAAPSVSAKTLNNCLQFNRAAVDRVFLGSKTNFLLSPVTGGGVHLDKVALIFCGCYMDAGDQKAQSHDKGANTPRTPIQLANFAAEQFGIWGQHLIKDGKTITDVDESSKLLLEEAEKFVNSRLPYLRALKVI